MSAEDTDWLVYHRIPQTGEIPERELAADCGLDDRTLADSLARLDRSCLVERGDGRVRMLSFGEALIKNQFKNDEDLPYVIENGVIKARKP